MFTAVLGGKTEVETLSGKVVLSIPPGTQSGQTFRLAKERAAPVKVRLTSTVTYTSG